jgi:hypothetical protein
LDDGHEDDGEEGADVDDFEDAAELPREAEGEEDGEEEEDVAARGGAAALLAWGERLGVGIGRGGGGQCGLLERQEDGENRKT